MILNYNLNYFPKFNNNHFNYYSFFYNKYYCSLSALWNKCSLGQHGRFSETLQNLTSQILSVNVQLVWLINTHTHFTISCYSSTHYWTPTKHTHHKHCHLVPVKKSQIHSEYWSQYQNNVSYGWISFCRSLTLCCTWTKTTKESCWSVTLWKVSSYNDSYFHVNVTFRRWF